MRVLMFGWEFPPSISGGLGVACEGLVRGLLENEADETGVFEFEAWAPRCARWRPTPEPPRPAPFA
ncbi:MAG: hypothetical protein WEB59_02415 [Thermoanaerobaculia bacterium]